MIKKHTHVYMKLHFIENDERKKGPRRKRKESERLHIKMSIQTLNFPKKKKRESENQKERRNKPL